MPYEEAWNSFTDSFSFSAGLDQTTDFLLEQGQEFTQFLTTMATTTSMPSAMAETSGEPRVQYTSTDLPRQREKLKGSHWKDKGSAGAEGMTWKARQIAAGDVLRDPISQ